MRPETLKKVRIRAQGPPRESGSVSPPAIELSGEGKTIFVEKMRSIYGKTNNGALNEQELEMKIELLWKGLNPSQREKFIGKENNTEKSPPVQKKVPVPMLERRNNCKAIAKVLDLKSTKNPANSYSQMIKGRMKSWWKEGQMINSRVCPPSPPRDTEQQPCTSSSSISPPLLIVNTQEDAPEFEAPPPIPEALKIPTPPPTPAKEPEKAAPKPKTAIKVAPNPEPSPTEQLLRRKAREFSRISAPPKPKKPGVKLMRVVTVVSKGPRVSYEQACQEYYRTLSQSFVSDSELLNETMMPAYASIVTGERLIREYKFGHSL